MRYFETMRMEWLSNRRAPFNRKDLMDKFSISMPQASNDIQKFLRENPNIWQYNTSRKRYERIGK